MKIDIYVDGSYSPTLQKYGCGIVVVKDGEVLREFSVPGNEPAFNKFHNVAGEVFAAMLALMWVTDNVEDPEPTLHYDYQGLELWVTGKWKTNSTLAIAYKEAVTKLPYKVNFVKVRAHTGNTFNERADALARKAVGLS